MDIAGKTFEITDKFPRSEDYGFTSQIRRSVLSISANIARPVKYHFVAPIEYIIYMGQDLDYECGMDTSLFHGARNVRTIPYFR